MSHNTSRERLNELVDIVAELNDNLPTVFTSTGGTKSADVNLERITNALAIITEELRERHL